jgi:hypothetical protein
MECGAGRFQRIAKERPRAYDEMNPGMEIRNIYGAFMNIDEEGVQIADFDLAVIRNPT